MYDVDFYTDKDGKKPIKEFIEELEKKGETSKRERIRANKIYTYMYALEQYGTRIGEPVVKHIEGELWELRPNNDRVFFFFWKDNKFIMLHHFLKKTNKTPKREIEQAKKNMLDHLERSQSNE